LLINFYQIRHEALLMNALQLSTSSAVDTHTLPIWQLREITVWEFLV